MEWLHRGARPGVCRQGSVHTRVTAWACVVGSGLKTPWLLHVLHDPVSGLFGSNLVEQRAILNRKKTYLKVYLFQSSDLESYPENCPRKRPTEWLLPVFSQSLLAPTHCRIGGHWVAQGGRQGPGKVEPLWGPRGKVPPRPLLSRFGRRRGPISPLW